MNGDSAVAARVRSVARAALLLGVAAVAVAQQGATGRLVDHRDHAVGHERAGGAADRRSSSTGPSCRSAAWTARRPRFRSRSRRPLRCQWRWLDTSALACQLGDGDELTLATRYTLVDPRGITAEDGATTSGVRRHEFVTRAAARRAIPVSRRGAAPARP